MQEVRLYILSEQKGNTCERGRVAYELETTLKNGRNGSLSDHIYLTDRNKNGATLEGIIEGLSRISEDTNVSLFLFTESTVINTQIMAGNLEKWHKADFMTSKGEPVKYSDLWQEVYELIKTKVKGGITGCAPVPPEKQRLLESIIRKE